MISKILKISLISLLILFIPFITCKKKTPTTPETENLTHPVIWTNVFEMSFTASEIGPNPSSQVLQVKNTGAGTLNYTISDDADWLSVEPTSGSSTGNIVEHTVSVNKTGLAAKDEAYKATITVTSAEACNSPQKVSVSLKVTKEPPPKIWVSPKNLDFNAEEGGSNPGSKNINIKNSGKGTLNYTITVDVPWMDVNPKSGTSKGEINTHRVRVNISGLNEGSYNGIITITDPNATNSPQTVNVDLEISKKGPTPPPCPEYDKISIYCSPDSGGTGTIVTIPVRIECNSNEIKAFGLDFTYDTTMFEYQGVERGSLTGGWASVDGNETSPGTVKIGGFAGGASPIPKESKGSIVEVKLKVTCNGCSDGQQSQICISNYTDDISGMKPSNACTSFTYRK